MRVLSLSDIGLLVEELKRGNTAIFPTETSYGLGCDATQAAAVERIFAIKARPKDKPLLIVVPTVEEAKKYLRWNDVLAGLAKKFWPGPLTIVGEYQASSGPPLAPGVVAADGAVALRVTADPWLQSVFQHLSAPLVATSANIAGEASIYNFKDILAVFGESDVRPDCAVDAGVLPVRPPTTLVSVVGGKLRVLRQGEVRVSEKE